MIVRAQAVKGTDDGRIAGELRQVIHLLMHLSTHIFIPRACTLTCLQRSSKPHWKGDPQAQQPTELEGGDEPVVEAVMVD
jgi:hypothetical protein